MPKFDVTIPVKLTVLVEAENAERAAWILRHSFDSRHANDPTAGIHLPVGHGCTAQIMTCTFDASDRDDVDVREA